MDNDSGRGSRSDEPPPLATVSRLRLDESASRSGIAEDDWYETERLTGQITGRAPSAAATDEPPVTPGGTLVLDWRNPDPAPDAGAAQTLRRSLNRRGRPKVTLRVRRPHNSLRRHPPITAAEAPDRKPAEPRTSDEAEAAVNRHDATRSLLGFRHGPEPVPPKARRALSARVRARIPHLALGRGASVVAITLLAAATATIGIAAALRAYLIRPAPV